jgi:hypothetical protein
LREWDWDLQNYVTIEYPDEPIAQLMDWLRTTRSWHEDVELVHQRVRKLNAELAAIRSGLPKALSLTASTPAPVPPVPPKAPRQQTPEQRAALERARAALAAKRAAMKSVP